MDAYTALRGVGKPISLPATARCRAGRTSVEPHVSSRNCPLFVYTFILVLILVLIHVLMPILKTYPYPYTHSCTHNHTYTRIHVHTHILISARILMLTRILVPALTSAESRQRWRAAPTRRTFARSTYTRIITLMYSYSYSCLR